MYIRTQRALAVGVSEIVAKEEENTLAQLMVSHADGCIIKIT